MTADRLGPWLYPLPWGMNGAPWRPAAPGMSGNGEVSLAPGQAGAGRFLDVERVIQ